MRCHASQPIMAGSTRVVSSPLPEPSLLARSCNKAERERFFVFGESLPSRFSRSSTTLMRDGKVPVASSIPLADIGGAAPWTCAHDLADLNEREAGAPWETAARTHLIGSVPARREQVGTVLLLQAPRLCITLSRDIMSSFILANGSRATPFQTGPTQRLRRRFTTTTHLATTIRPSLAAQRPLPIEN
jgi:hypothetical protein